MVVTRTLLLPLALVTAFGLSAAAAAAQTPPPAAQPPVSSPPSSNQPTATPSGESSTDPFGEEVDLPALTIVYLPGSGQWSDAYQTLVKAFTKVNDGLAKLGIKPDGAPLTIYTDPNDDGFSFQAAVPVKTAPNLPAGSDLKVGKAPEGRALRFVHRGSYDSVEATYEAITDRLDEKHLEARELIVEQYRKDLATTPEDDLVIDIYVPLKDADTPDAKSDQKSRDSKSEPKSGESKAGK
jgi:effector-binding domain-containing protein